MPAFEILLLLLGAVAGAIVAPIYNNSVDMLAKVRRNRASAKRGAGGRTSLLSQKLVKYYENAGNSGALYTPIIGDGSPIAVLRDPTVNVSPAVNLFTDPLFDCDHQYTRLPFNRSMLRRYRRRGARPFDGEFMWVKSARLDGNELAELTIGRVNFYSYATLLDRLQKEILSTWRQPVLHDRHLRDFRSALGGGGLQPQAIGCVTALLVEGPDGTYIAIARRSAKVVNAPGTRSLVPAYGMECNAIAGRVSRYGLTFYNFVREFVEEFFDLEELVHMMASRRVDPDWIFQLPPAADVLNEAAAGRLKLERTGV